VERETVGRPAPAEILQQRQTEITIINNSSNNTTVIKIICYDNGHKTDNTLYLNNFLLEELIVQREQCCFSWGRREPPGSFTSWAWAHAEVPTQKCVFGVALR